MKTSRQLLGWTGPMHRLPYYENGDWTRFRGIEGLSICIRVYPNGEWVVDPRTPDEIGELVTNGSRDGGWFAYNYHFRPGNTLFIDGKLVSLGLGLRPEQAAWIEQRLAAGKRVTNWVYGGAGDAWADEEIAA